MLGELGALARLAELLPGPPDGEVWIGDDAAVLRAPAGARLVFATDCVVEHVHFERGLSSLEDVGWKAVAVNVSDVAAMGATPLAAVAAVAGASGEELELLTSGIAAAAERFGCPLVGGDLSFASELVLSVAVLGTCPGDPVLRSGARAGDLLYVTGPLGSSAAGLRALRSDPRATGPLVDAHRRPLARLAEGAMAAAAGATAMIDCSDGFGLDLDRLARSSGVGLELLSVPVAPGATTEEAMGGGEDYELIFCAPRGVDIEAAFSRAGLREPLLVGRCVADRERRSLEGGRFEAAGYEHPMG